MLLGSLDHADYLPPPAAAPAPTDVSHMSIGPNENAGLGPCELQDPVWAKMSALAAGVNKKRKKPDTKPQAQINKCNNEKRRREQENIYIEELAELISANIADMSSMSVKPDKCAILQETVSQIRSIKQRESNSQSSDPVQQGEVSSSRPTILSNEVYGPLLLEALEGFLFVVNAEGKIEHVTENVTTYIKYTSEEVLGKSIYNFIHHGDHARFSSNLLPMSIGWASEPTNKSRSFNCRLLVKSDREEESMEEKHQRDVRYELMHISSTHLKDQGAISDDESGDSAPCLLCVASRITHREKVLTPSIEQFTTKLDTTGKIIAVDTLGISISYSKFLNKDLKGRVLHELCVPQESNKLSQHLRETLSAGQATSVIYKLRIGPDKFVQVQTKSKFFKHSSNNDIDFIMATHTIIGDNDSTGPSDPGGGTNTGVGGPLMTSVVNGTTRNGAPVSSGSESSTTSTNNTLLNTNSGTFTFPLESSEFGFDILTSSTWELDSTSWAETRPDSRQSVTPVSTPTPRPPSASAYSPATTVAQSPMPQYVTQPSPTVANPSTPANPYNNTFPFSPITENYQIEEQKDTKANVMNESSESTKLRNILSQPRNPVDSGSDDKKNTILKGLLKQPDEDENKNDNNNSPGGRNSLPGPSEKNPKSNYMLLQLLNNNDDDEHQSELYRRLAKPEETKTETHSSTDDTLLASLGFPNTPSNERGRKRTSDERDDGNGAKRSSDGTQVTSTGTGSKLCEKNKMLASLLAIQPNNLQQPIPVVPASVLTATPQEKLPRITPDPNLNKNIPNRMIQQQNNMPQPNMLNNTRPQRMAGRPPNTNYLTQILTPAENMQRNQNRQFNNQQVDSTYTSPATSSTDTTMWDPQTPDPLLSQILEQVIDFVPENVTNNSEIFLLNSIDSQQTISSNFQTREAMSEKMAINIIEKSLMQCESAVKSPSSPTITLPGTPPAYSSATMTQTNQSGFPPPPNYPRTPLVGMQRPQVRQGAPQYAIAAGVLNQQQLLLQQQQQQQQQQRNKQIQEQQKRRLLQQQKQQQILIPSNVATELAPGIHNIDSLLNNTVAPNVSLQRSTSAPESQLSPNYVQQINQQNQRLNNQPQPYSPHSQMASPISQQQANFTQNTSANYQQSGARLSPHPPFNQQLSPRQAYTQSSTGQGNNWQQPARLSVQQQQNPMLNAQLTGNYGGPNNRGFNVQRAPPQQQRGIGSPGAAATRQSPYPTDNFAPPASPNSSYNQSQYLRLQRTNSAPTATTQLPGGLGSPRPYGRDLPPHNYPPIPPPQHTMMYQQDSQYGYEQTGLHIPYNGADRGRGPPHLQAGVTGSGTTSEYVRQELRAVVGARTGQAQQPNLPRQQSQLMNQNVNASDLDLALNFDMPTSGASESPKLWGAMGSDMGSISPQPTTSRSTMEEARQGDSKSSSLLQKLLSE